MHLGGHAEVSVANNVQGREKARHGLGQRGRQESSLLRLCIAH